MVVLEIKNKKIQKLLKLYEPLWALGQIEELLAWDSRVVMPKKGIEFRSKLEGVVSSLKQYFYLQKELEATLKEAEEENLTVAEQGIVRHIKRTLKIYKALPPEFVKEFAVLTSKASSVWEEAKKNSDFASFAPYLEKIVEMSLQKAEYLGYKEHPYDALLDLYEEGWTTKDFENFFNEIKPVLKELLEKIQSSENYLQEHPLEKEEYDSSKLHQLSLRLISEMGFSAEVSRLDVSAHPFTVGINRYDARITTRYKGYDFRDPIGSTVHEWGHALYELQISPELEGTPLAQGASYGFHESQSRFWENIVLRSPAYLTERYQLFQEYLPFLERYQPEEVVRYFNLVKPGLIRVEADELTYHSHIMLRFELEKALLSKEIKVQELPIVWKEKMKEYLGIEPSSDREGVLQDIHWSEGYFGYFPTYSLGTFISGFLKFHLEKEVGKLEDLVKSKEELDKIRDWLGKKVHYFGATFPPKKIFEEVFKEDFTPRYHLDYLQEKYSRIYS